MAPERDAGLMPCARQNGVFAFGTIDGEEVERLVLGVGQTYGYDDMAGTYVGETSERLLNPELLQSHFTPTFYFFFKFSGFFVFYFYSRFCSSVFKLYFTTHAPSFSEIVANHDYYMR